MTAKTQPQSSVYVALVHEVLNVERFATIADLADAVKTRAARLRIRYDSDVVSDAIQHVGHTRALLVPPEPPASPPVAPERHDPPRADAAALLATIRERLQTSAGPRPLDTQPDHEARVREQARAMRAEGTPRRRVIGRGRFAKVMP